MSWISRHKLPVILTAIALVLAAVAVVVVTAFIQPRHQQENDYATATKRLAAAQKANQKAHDAFDTALKSVTELRTSMAELPDAPKGLFPAASLAKFTADVKDLDQAASTQAPTALTDLPKGDVSYSVATKALTRARTGVMETPPSRSRRPTQSRTPSPACTVTCRMLRPLSATRHSRCSLRTRVQPTPRRQLSLHRRTSAVTATPTASFRG